MSWSLAPGSHMGWVVVSYFKISASNLSYLHLFYLSTNTCFEHITYTVYSAITWISLDCSAKTDVLTSRVGTPLLQSRVTWAMTQFYHTWLQQGHSSQRSGVSNTLNHFYRQFPWQLRELINHPSDRLEPEQDFCFWNPTCTHKHTHKNKRLI